MLNDKPVKKLFAEYLKTPEAKILQGNFQLSNAPELLKIMKNSADPGHFLELVMDYCDKSQRKGEGTFYTPGIVAEKMFHRALEVFIKNNPDPESLFNIKVLDPACGSGEFILAALKVLLEIFSRMKPDIPIEKLLYYIINNNLYGIDCNSNGIELLLKRLNIYGKVAEDHFIIRDVLEFSDAANCFGNNLKFDIVIGNPPYVSYGLRNVGKLEKKRSTELRKRFPFSAEYKITLYALFIEFAIKSTAENGVHSFIVPDSFLCGQYFTKLRNFMLKNSSFEYFYLIRQKLFKAVPGSLVIYIVSKKPPFSTKTFRSAELIEQSDFYLPEDGYNMLQSEFSENHRQRFRLFFNGKIHNIVKNLENNSVCKLSDLLEISSGLIAKNGKFSIISDTPRADGIWKPGLITGKEISVDGTVIYHGKFINCDPSMIKSGLKNIDYSKPKILIRQTGDRVISAVDRNGLVVLNNIHVGIAKQPGIDLERLSEYLNSNEMLTYYQAVTLEANRPMAQTDLETLRELPIKEYFIKSLCSQCG